MNAYLGAEAATPLTAEEFAALGQHERTDCECIMPVPSNTGIPAFKLPGRGDPDHRYTYKNAAGAVLGYVLRWNANAGAEKEIRPATYWRNGSGKGSWRLKAWPGLRPLYGLAQLTRYPNAIVLLTEGEKTAEAVEHGPLAEPLMWAKHRVIGITWSGGTNGLEYTDFSPLTARDVIILPDNDEPGERAADQLVDKLCRIGVRKLRRWRPPAECDAIAEEPPPNITPEEMVASILEAPEVEAETPKSAVVIDFEPYAFPDPTTIPAREWLAGTTSGALWVRASARLGASRAPPCSPRSSAWA